MADDRELLIGKWTVWVKNWKWEYEFSSDGTVTWKDTRSPEKGTGRWAMTAGLVNMFWLGSSTRESWQRPLSAASNSKTWYSSTYFNGAYQIEKVVATPAPASNVSVNPQVANVPWERYIDQFTNCEYDLNYKIPPDASFAYSTILQLTYGDGVLIEMDFSELEDRSLSPDAARDAMAQGYLGRAGRIFPKVLASATVPRLWSARSKALADQDADFKAFAGVGMAGVAFVLTVPAMPAGLPPAAGATVTKTRVPGVQRGTRAALSEAELTAINAIRQRPEYAKLTIEEVAAIRSYSGNNWDKINLFLRGGGGSAQTQAEAKTLISALEKLPGYRGNVIRSEAGQVSDVLQRYRQGQTFRNEGMLSTSRGGAVAQREGNVGITIKAVGKNGKDISQAAVHGAGGGNKEMEVLFPPGTSFIVESVTPVGQAVMVVLREL